MQKLCVHVQAWPGGVVGLSVALKIESAGMDSMLYMSQHFIKILCVGIRTLMTICDEYTRLSQSTKHGKYYRQINSARSRV